MDDKPSYSEVPPMTKEEEALMAESSSTAGKLPLRQRRWDDPPNEDEKPIPDDPQGGGGTSLICAIKSRVELIPRSDTRTIMNPIFAPYDTHVIYMVPVSRTNNRMTTTFPQRATSIIRSWDLRRIDKPITTTNRTLMVDGDFVLRPVPELAVATIASLEDDVGDMNGTRSVIRHVYTVFDLRKCQNSRRIDVDAQPPLASSPDGTLFAAACATNPSHVNIYRFAGGATPGIVALTLRRCIPHHITDVTHIAFMPNGTGLVSISRDGVGRISSVATGRTLRKFEVPLEVQRYGLGLLSVSPDGELIVSIWGAYVFLWYPSTERTEMYNLQDRRSTEGWPLCISPNCAYLVCRTEAGFDISDLMTGNFLGEVQAPGSDTEPSSFVSAAAVSNSGQLLCVGRSNGVLELYDLVTVYHD